MRRDLKAAAGMVAVVTATAAFAVLAGSTPGNAETTPSSAYAVSAVGPLPIEPTPYIESVDGKTRTSSMLDLPENPLLSLRAATTSAGRDSAAVELADLALGAGAFDALPEIPAELRDQCAALPDTGVDDLPELPELPEIPVPGFPTLDDLPASNLPELCQLLLDVPDSVLEVDLLNIFCKGDTGNVDVGTLKVLGQVVDLPSTEPNTQVPVGPLLTLTVNKQTKNADGSFTVKGLEVDLGGGTEVITLGSATCATPAARSRPPIDTNAPADAPTPTPVTVHHPVTG